MSFFSGFRPHEMPFRRSLARAAVALIEGHDESGEQALLFIRRTHREDDPWSGDMAFPGGRMQPTDCEPRQTAIRETQEETGLDLVRHGRMVCRMSDRLTREHTRWRPMVVTPYLFTWPQSQRGLPSVTLNHEAQAAVWVPKWVLASSEYRAIRPLPTPLGTLRLPCCRYQDYCIWGLSFSLVQEYLRRRE